MFEAFLMILVRLIESGDAFVDLDNPTFAHHVILNDFGGFDADGLEIEREYNDPEMVDALFELLDQGEANDDVHSGFYHFPDFDVDIHYTSEDI